MFKLPFFLVGLPALAVGIYGCIDPQISAVTVFLGFLFGLAFSAAGTFIHWMDADERKKALYLQEHGRWVEAEVQWIEQEDDSQPDEEATFRLWAVWKNPETGLVHGFEASEIWPNPRRYIRNNRIQVRVDERDATNYAIDWSFLPDED
ncbi:hypothetical protein [Pseudomonas nitroreducens]|uniref:DUF3592 domain-containing protein n=1 Tax=Pseudomonas nitroreducens TaxID=46680 RepID=A0A246F835_PSENT|nr:hypothetical protein [Pseudomonas nitroreducens]OWP49781.1 hypothetical protein CEG18_15175 [Pseudomonas nitroreducens]